MSAPRMSEWKREDRVQGTGPVEDFISLVKVGGATALVSRRCTQCGIVLSGDAAAGVFSSPALGLDRRRGESARSCPPGLNARTRIVVSDSR